MMHYYNSFTDSIPRKDTIGLYCEIRIANRELQIVNFKESINS